MKKIFGILFTFAILLACTACGRKEDEKGLELLSRSQQKDVIISVNSRFSATAFDPENSYNIVSEYESYETGSIFFSSEYSLEKRDIEAVYEYLRIGVPDLRPVALGLSDAQLKTYNYSYTVEEETVIDFSEIAGATGLVGAALVADMDVYEFRYLYYSTSGDVTMGDPFTVMLCRTPKLICVIL